MTRSLTLSVLALLVVWSCAPKEDDPIPPGDTPSDTTEDTATPTPVDTDTEEPPASTADTSTAEETGWPDELDGFGDIQGRCGDLPDILQVVGPQLIHNRIDFADEVFDASALSAGGQTIEATPNRGGSSVLSEAISYDVLYRCEQAALLQTEAEITYDPPESPKTDIRVEVDGSPVGVSVTRAFTFPPGTPMSADAAEELMRDKLNGAATATANVTADLAWDRHILHVMAYDDQHADAMTAAWQAVHQEAGADTIVWITTTHGRDGFVYNIDDP